MSGGQRSFNSFPYRISITIVLLCGALVAAGVYHETRRNEDDRAEIEFSRRTALHHALIREVLNRHIESIAALSTLLSLDTTVTRSEFARVTAQLEQRISGALAFEWVPIVRNADRAKVEEEMRKIYPARQFQFRDFDVNGRIRRAAERPVHYPICYVEPMQGNELVLGYDLQTAPTRRFLDRARETHRMTVSNQFRLIQETGQKLGFVITFPVFRSHGDGSDTATDNSCVGFVQCVFHVHDLLETACASQPNAMLEMLFIDGSESDPDHRILYYRPVSGDTPGAAPMTEQEFKRTTSVIREQPLPMGEREWRVLYRPRADWLEQQHTRSPLLRSSTVMLFSMLAAGLIYVIGRRTETIRDEVTQRTAELAESRRQFANLVHSLPGMAFRATYKGNIHVSFASEGALALTGWSAEDIMSEVVRVADFVHPDDIDRVRKETQAALKARRDVEVEYRIRTRNGTEKTVLSRSRGVYDPSGNLESLEGIVIDITDAKRAEESRLALERKLLETQKLESLGLLAGGIAHDFNNLLSAILGNASLARMSLDPGNSADPQLRAIETASLRAAELCRQMLAYAGKGRFVVERVDLSAIVEELLPLLRVSIAQSAVLHLQLSRDLPGVKADATQVRQIVMNLVLNAVDALAGRSGEIAIRTSLVSVDRDLLSRCVTGQGLPLGEYVCLEVSDNGCGMSADVRAKIFDPFFTTKFAGRGLGLAAVLGIVRGHNGALLVESEVDKGSTFRLYLPAIVGELVRIDPPAATPAEPWHQTGNVLVIEDEEPVRMVMVELLKSFGFNVRSAADGRSGIAVFQEDSSRWSLVVIDLLMPGMNGEETLKALRALRPDIRVLLVSGYSDSDVLNRTRGKGRVGFLPKPFRRDGFETKLKELFS